MHSVLKRAAVAAMIIGTGLVGASAASAHEYDTYRHDGWGYPHHYWDGWGYPHRYWGGYWGGGLDLSLGLAPPPVYVHRTYVDVVPGPTVVRYVSTDSRAATVARELGYADRRLDDAHAMGRISSADFLRLKGRSDLIRGEAVAIERSHGGAIPAPTFGDLQAKVDSLNWSISRDS